MMNTLVYLGNKLSSSGKTPTTIETLSIRLAKDFTVHSYSHYKNTSFRLLHMLWGVFRHSSPHTVVLIDTYSTAAFNYAWLASLWARCLRQPYIIFLHGGNFENRILRSRYRAKLVLNKAAKVVSPSGFLREVVGKHFPGVIVDVIPNSINLSDYSYRDRDPTGIKLFWLRSFHQIYNPVMAVRVLDELIKRGVSAQLHMVGPDKDGSLSLVKQDVIKCRLESVVFFHGKLSLSEWQQIAEECSYFINTTNFDNTPVSVLEAMALGMPVISTNVGGLPYLVSTGRNGILTEPDRADQMTEAIIQLMNNPIMYRNMSREAYLTAKEHDWGSVRMKWKMLIEELEHA